MLVIVIGALLICSFAPVASSKNVAPKNNIFAERPLIHILGPSPAITPNPDPSAVDSKMLESGDVFKDNDGTWYWYYHAKSQDKERWPGSYRICVATAKDPLGPWKRYKGNPVLDLGEKGDWDGKKTACAAVMKEGGYDVKSADATYYMWYWSGGGNLGLATAKNPLGPWKKYEGNPIMRYGEDGGGYIGSVTKIGDTFTMFVQSPVSAEDQGPFCIATAPKPEGPWTKYDGNSPVMTPGDWGAWDDGGFSEAAARYHEGIFHCIYGGTKAPKIEPLGYAWSFDAINWHKYQANPIVPLSRVPDASAFAEVHCFVEGSYIYVFHTLRFYTGEGTARGIPSGSGKWLTEDLAVQVLTIDPQFKVSFPILMMDSLGARQSSRIAACLPIGLEAASKLAIATECTYDSGAKAGVRIHVRGSDDGVHCDTIDMFSFDIDLQPGKTVRKTVNLSPNSKFAKVIVENLDKANAVKSVIVTTTVGN